MPVQAFTFEVKALTDQGQFTGLASTYGNVDLAGDVVMPGAFTATLQSGKQRPLMFEHKDAIGLVTLSDSPQGLVANGQLSMGIQRAQEALVLLRDGVMKGLSIGYLPIRDQITDGIRQLLEVKLFEVSVVVFPCNEAALVSGVKASQLKAAQAARQAKILTALKSLRADTLAAFEKR